METFSSPPTAQPSILRWTLGFLLVGIAWGLTTPFIRRAALSFHPPARPWIDSPQKNYNIIVRRVLKLAFGAWDLIRCPQYALPLLINLTGSVWFFVLVGGAELSLTVPITNSLAFLFTVLGEWWVEGKVIGRDTWVGMAFVLGGIALCVQSKNT
ncbi:MAG: hypothetical protein MMC33_002547 [Icmadophila ericetorum]|nr:hypothetical protein [Icmadophila ericetorum]